MEHKVFLSVGSPSNQTQENFVKAVENYLTANELIPQTVGRTYYSSLQPLKAVEELLKECNGTIILALERAYLVEAIDRRDSPKQKNLNGLKLTTPWNQIEGAIAYANGLPLLVLIEAGVKDDGLLEKGYDWYVLEIDMSLMPDKDPRFVGVIADWKKRVAQYAARKTQTKPVQETAESPSSAKGTAESHSPSALTPPPPATNTALIRRNLVSALNDDELADVCFDMKVDYDGLRGDSKNAKVRELLALCERSGRLLELLTICRQIRPNIEWVEK